MYLRYSYLLTPQVRVLSTVFIERSNLLLYWDSLYICISL